MNVHSVIENGKLLNEYLDKKQKELKKMKRLNHRNRAEVNRRREKVYKTT